MKKITLLLALLTGILSCNNQVKKSIKNSSPFKGVVDTTIKSYPVDKKPVVEIQQKWLLEFKGKSTNTLIWDERFSELEDIVIPDREVNLLGFPNTLKESFTSVIGGPPNEIKIETNKNYMVASACRQHSCSEKGFLWFDLLANKGVIAIVNHFPNKMYNDTPHLYVSSKNVAAKNQLNEQLIFEIKEWLKNEDLDIPESRWTYEF